MRCEICGQRIFGDEGYEFSTMDIRMAEHVITEHPEECPSSGLIVGEPLTDPRQPC